MLKWCSIASHCLSTLLCRILFINLQYRIIDILFLYIYSYIYIYIIYTKIIYIIFLIIYKLLYCVTTATRPRCSYGRDTAVYDARSSSTATQSGQSINFIIMLQTRVSVGRDSILEPSTWPTKKTLVKGFTQFKISTLITNFLGLN